MLPRDERGQRGKISLLLVTAVTVGDVPTAFEGTPATKEELLVGMLHCTDLRSLYHRVLFVSRLIFCANNLDIPLAHPNKSVPVLSTARRNAHRSLVTSQINLVPKVYKMCHDLGACLVLCPEEIKYGCSIDMLPICTLHACRPGRRIGRRERWTFWGWDNVW